MAAGPGPTPLAWLWWWKPVEPTLMLLGMLTLFVLALRL